MVSLPVTRWNSQSDGPIASMEYGGRTRAGCASCRKKKLKCDNEVPSCARCKKTGEACIRGFTHRSYNESPEFKGFGGFPKGQKWHNPKVQPKFRHEYQNISSLYTVISSPIPGTQLIQQKTSTQPASGSLPRITELNKPQWPLNKVQLHLFDHFISFLAVWLDLCDPRKTFQVEVPKRAQHSELLLNAIFALAARHLNKTSHYDEYASDLYHSRCIGFMIFSLKNPTEDSNEHNETLFAATIILRVLEEIDMPMSAAINKPTTAHLSGITHLVNSRKLDDWSGFIDACYWVGLRQEIYNALSNQTPIALRLDTNIGSLGMADGYAWANRAVQFCANVMNLCFSEEGVSTAKWEKLNNYASDWTRLSGVVEDTDVTTPEDAFFPVIYYQEPHAIIGIQHHYLGRMLLEFNNPHIPCFGPTRRDRVCAMESRVMLLLRELCGIGQYCDKIAPAIFTASMGIAIAGDLFSDRQQQEKLMGVLIRTEQKHARPTKAIQEQLKRAWGWEKKS
ncbi:hypothetical protein BJ878DRAFT_539508 [Calycina marina]|uniref:Zn(2)-C6 fungal-type domain-containing protein n=1 Tax=Calycina marina TaxID=1763456 RepID=A0A9P7Z8C5_9HELO|nr:hypothetical protein BJ878DRAFT_539508 [Calycina marina]